MPRVGLLGKQAGGSGPSYSTTGVAYDGSTNYLHRGGDFTGNADGPLGIFSCWFINNGNAGTSRALIRNLSTATVNVSITSSDVINVSLTDVGAANALSFNATNTLPTSSSWHSLMCAWDTNHAAGSKILQVYLDGVAIAGTIGDSGAAFNIDYTRTDWGIGAASNGINKLNGAMDEVYLNVTQTIDLSNLVNRYKWRGLTDHPADLGANGSTPTGSQPILYIKGGHTAWATNLGSGGNLTAVGTFVDSSTNP